MWCWRKGIIICVSSGSLHLIFNHFLIILFCDYVKWIFAMRPFNLFFSGRSLLCFKFLIHKSRDILCLQNYVVVILFIFARGVIKFVVLLLLPIHFGPIALILDIFLIPAFHETAHLIGWGPLRFFNKDLGFFV